MKLHLFYCSNSIERDALDPCRHRLNDIDITCIDLPCSGKVTIPYLMKAFETGADGVLILTCKVGDCHYLEGNLRASKRAEMVDSLLEEIGFGSQRITAIHWTDEGIEKVYQDIAAFCEKISQLSANPVSSSAS